MKKSLGPQTLVYPTPLFIVGSYSATGKPDAMAVAWGGICCSNPPAVAISVRKSRQTYENILASQAFTINIPSEYYLPAADYFGITSGKTKDKFQVTGLTPIKSDLVNAPYIKEFPLILECQLIHTLPLGAHTQFVGKILDVKADAAVLDADGNPDIEKIKPLIFCPDSSMLYRRIGKKAGQAFSIGRDLATEKRAS